MADNIQTPAGSGGDPAVATDEIAGAHYQKIKIALGAEDELDTLLDAGQQAMANSVPVAIASNQSAVPISAASLPLPSGAATLAGQSRRRRCRYSVRQRHGADPQPARSPAVPPGDLSARR